MSAILLTDHKKILRKMKKRLILCNLVWLLIACVLVFSPYYFKLERDLFSEAYSVAKMEFDSVLARQELLNMLRSKPLTIGQALDLVDVVMSQSEVPVPIVLGIIAQESEFNPNAVSVKGAKGLMQVIPATFRNYSNHPLLNGPRQIKDPIMNMKAGISYLEELNKIFNGNLKKTLRAYYAGPDRARNQAYNWYAESVLKKAEKFERR